MFLLATMVSQALAAEPTFDQAAVVEEAAKPETRLTANIGGNFTTGNSEAVSVNGGFDMKHHWKRNQFGLVGGVTVGFGAVDENADGFLERSERCLGVKGKDCASTAERYALDARYDRFLTKRDSLYVLVGAFRDPFAGFALRSHAQVGYDRLLVDLEATHLDLEVGIDAANEAYVAGVDPRSARLLAAQVALKFDHSFNESVGFANTVTVYEPILTQPAGSPFAPHLSDLRIANVATISAKMTDKLGISVSDTLTWRNEPVAAPAGVDETRAKLDNTLSIALVASIL